MKAIFVKASALLLVFSAALGCGSYNGSSANATPTPTPGGCTPTALNVIPDNAVLNHAALTHSQQFGATLNPTPATTCTPIPAFTVTWASSNPTDVPISNNQDSTNGTATCLSTASQQVTITATLPAGASGNTAAVTGTATVTCN